MKVIDERKIPKRILFGKLKVGECFVDEAYDIMMKIYRNRVNHPNAPNAVDLVTGAACELNDDDEVTLITTVLKIIE